MLTIDKDQTLEEEMAYHEHIACPNPENIDYYTGQFQRNPTPDLHILCNGYCAEYKSARPCCPRPQSVKSAKKIDKTALVYYYEVNVENLTRDFSIGLTTELFPVNKAPGLTRKFSPSFGFTTNGRVYVNKNLEVSGNRYTIGDVVGCGIEFPTKRVFFTLNGQIICEVPNAPLDNDLYATLCVFSPGDRVYVNFGQVPYVFDYNAHYYNVRTKLIKQIANTKINTKEIYEIVKSYLCFQGFTRTFVAFENNKVDADRQHKRTNTFVSKIPPLPSISKNAEIQSEVSISVQLEDEPDNNLNVAAIENEKNRRIARNFVEEIVERSGIVIVEPEMILETASVLPVPTINTNNRKTSNQISDDQDKNSLEIDVMYKMEERAKVREAIIDGDIIGARKLIHLYFTKTKSCKQMNLVLKVQYFLETFAKKELKAQKFLKNKLKKNFNDKICLVEDTSTLAYKEISVKVTIYRQRSLKKLGTYQNFFARKKNQGIMAQPCSKRTNS